MAAAEIGDCGEGFARQMIRRAFLLSGTATALSGRLRNESDSWVLGRTTEVIGRLGAYLT